MKTWNRKMKTWQLLTAVSVGAGLAGAAHGAVLDTFAGGTINSTNGVVFVSQSNDTNNWIDDYRDGSDLVLYYGFDFTVDSNANETGSGGYFAALQLYDSGAERLGVGNGWENLTLSSFGHGGVTDLNPVTNYVIGTTYRLVVRIDYNPGSNDDVATVWINPVNEASANSNLGAANAEFTEVRLRSGTTNSSGTTYGNIIFATTFDEAAIPEPSSLALLGIGGLCMLRRRRSS